MVNKLFSFLLVLVLGGCAVPAQTTDTVNPQKSHQCQCVKCQCQHCKEGSCDCAHNKASAQQKICEPL